MIMFTLEQIKAAHSKVKSGSDFPQYIRSLKALGVDHYTTKVDDGTNEYFGCADFKIESEPKYLKLTVADKVESQKFEEYLKAHQQGKSDYLTFCNQAAKTGVESWTVLLDKMTCTYYDKTGNSILIENVPQ